MASRGTRSRPRAPPPGPRARPRSRAGRTPPGRRAGGPSPPRRGPDAVQQRRLQPAEAEVQALGGRPARRRAGEVEGFRVALARQPVDLRAAGVAEAEDAGALVERLSRGVVQRLAEDRVAAGCPLGDERVAATGHQAELGGSIGRRWGRAARDLGYEYLAICDHTPNVRVVPGLDADDLHQEAEEIAAANDLLAPFRILRGSEVDIRADGETRPPRRRARRARLGAAEPPRRSARAPRRAHEQGDERDAASRRELP